MLEQVQGIIKFYKEEGLIRTKDISDGYHTFGELYDHRAKLFAMICNTYSYLAWKSTKHHDGTMFGAPGEMFIVGITTPEGDYSYHYHMEYWDMFKVDSQEFAPEFDGHQPSDIDRLFSIPL